MFVQEGVNLLKDQQANLGISDGGIVKLHNVLTVVTVIIIRDKAVDAELQGYIVCLGQVPLGCIRNIAFLSARCLNKKKLQYCSAHLNLLFNQISQVSLEPDLSFS